MYLSVPLDFNHVVLVVSTFAFPWEIFSYRWPIQLLELPSILHTIAVRQPPLSYSFSFQV